MDRQQIAVVKHELRIHFRDKRADQRFFLEEERSMYNPIIKTMTNESLDIVRIFYKDGTVKETTVKEAEKIVPVSTDRYYRPDGLVIIETFKDGSIKEYETVMKEVK